MNPLNALAGRCLQPLGHFSGTFYAYRVTHSLAPFPASKARHSDGIVRLGGLAFLA